MESEALPAPVHDIGVAGSSRLIVSSRSCTTRGCGEWLFYNATSWRLSHIGKRLRFGSVSWHSPIWQLRLLCLYSRWRRVVRAEATWRHLWHGLHLHLLRVHAIGVLHRRVGETPAPHRLLVHHHDARAGRSRKAHSRALPIMAGHSSALIFIRPESESPDLGTPDEETLEHLFSATIKI